MTAGGGEDVVTERMWADRGIELGITDDDRTALAEGIIDFFTLSYYQTNTVTTHPDAEMTAGNISSGGKNPYLETNDWG